MTSVGLGAVGVVAVLYALVVVLFRQHLPPVLAHNPVPALGCLYWLIAPIGAAAGALVLDERLDVVRWAKVGLVLNLIAFCGALCVTYRVWRLMMFIGS